MSNRSEISRAIFFDTSVHLQKVKDCLSGENEEQVIRVLEGMDYKLGNDFVRQHPIGLKYVLDFAFVNEQVAIEIDGASHKQKKQKRMDTIRDRFLHSNNWVTIRIQDDEFHGYKASFYKSLIREIVEERRKQYKQGLLFPIDFPKFVESDYE
jgi:very-short-patch-repair endonuclease